MARGRMVLDPRAPQPAPQTELLTSRPGRPGLPWSPPSPFSPFWPWGTDGCHWCHLPNPPPPAKPSGTPLGSAGPQTLTARTQLVPRRPQRCPHLLPVGTHRPRQPLRGGTERGQRQRDPGDPQPRTGCVRKANLGAPASLTASPRCPFSPCGPSAHCGEKGWVVRGCWSSGGGAGTLGRVLRVGVSPARGHRGLCARSQRPAGGEEVAQGGTWLIYVGQGGPHGPEHPWVGWGGLLGALTRSPFSPLVP